MAQQLQCSYFILPPSALRETARTMLTFEAMVRAASEHPGFESVFSR